MQIGKNYSQGAATLNNFGKSDYFKATMIAGGGLSGGISSYIAGGSFWKGVRQGLITSGLNHAAHDFVKTENSNMFRESEDEGITPSGTVELKGVPDEKLKDIAIIPEDANDETDTIAPDKNGIYKKVDGLYFSGFSDEKYWYKISNGKSALVTYNSSKNVFTIRDITSSLNPFNYIGYIGFKSIDEPHWVLNPFDN